jgi:hypothetical protein
MTYLYLDDGFADHPKILAISDAALRLHITALCYANRHLTDGHVPPEVVGRRTRLAQTLVEHELWQPNGNGWTIHDYLDYQKSAKKIREQRAAAAERKRRQRRDVTP